VEEFIHRENLALYKRRLAEPQTEAERAVLLKLLAEEEANEPRPKEPNDRARRASLSACLTPPIDVPTAE
jgi:hypothetical protein